MKGKLCVQFSVLLVLVAVLTGPAQAQTSTTQRRVTQTVDETNLTTLQGNTHPMARAEFDRGEAPADLPMQRMLLCGPLLLHHYPGTHQHDTGGEQFVSCCGDKHHAHRNSRHQWIRQPAGRRSRVHRERHASGTCALDWRNGPHDRRFPGNRHTHHFETTRRSRHGHGQLQGRPELRRLLIVGSRHRHSHTLSCSQTNCKARSRSLGPGFALSARPSEDVR